MITVVDQKWGERAYQIVSCKKLGMQFQSEL